MAEEDYNKRKMKTQRTGEVKMEDDFSILLPDEMILEFLSRLPMKSVMRFSSLSKYFYNSILKDAYFSSSHLINYAQKHPFLVFYHLNVNYGTNDQPMLHKNIFHIKGANEIQNAHGDFVDFGKTITTDCTLQSRGEFVGYCNGLVCFTPLLSAISYIDLWNFTTDELLRIFPPVIEHGGKGYRLVSYGFGFDSFSKEYKLVFIVLMLNTMSLKCWVYRFGTKSSWEQVSAPDYSSYPRTSPHSRKSEDVPSTFTKSTFTSYGGAGGGGALFWKTSNPRVILLFDLHQQEFQYIRFPVGGNESLTTDDTRLFEHKGYLVLATLETKLPVAGSRSRMSTLEKVHLNILKSYKDDQVWVKETVDLSPYSIPFFSHHCRLVSFCDQVLLYWLETTRFQFFNLHTKCRKVVRNLASCIFQKTSVLDLITQDYRLTSEVENISSLKTLLPKRAQRSDSGALDSIVKKGIGHIWNLQKPKTVGGFFISYSQSKGKEYFVFGD